MTEEEDSAALRDLEVRVREARQRQDTPRRMRKPPTTGVGIAFRIGTELVSALGVGVGIGYLLDRWMETTPLFLVVFFFLGAGAGVLNVYRAARDLGLSGNDDGMSGNDGTPGNDGGRGG